MRVWNKSRLLTSGVVIVILLGLIVLVARAEFLQWRQRALIQKEISGLRAQEQKLQSKNTELAESLAYLNTVQYKERVAKEQLNLKKDGEIVVSFPQVFTTNKIDDRQNNNIVGEFSYNIEKWWLYFFKR